MKNVLIVEDEEFLVQALHDSLDARGYSVAVADNGATGLESAKNTKPDIVLLDLLLPKLDGFSVLESMKKESGLKDIPVFILSNLSAEAEIKRAMDLGAERYYVKSEHPIKEIVDAVADRLEKGKPEPKAVHKNTCG